MSEIEKRLENLTDRIAKVEVYREKYEEERRKREELEREFTKQVERVSNLKAKAKIKEIEDAADRLRDEIKKKDEWLDQHGITAETPKQLEALKKIQEGFAVLLPSGTPITTTTPPEASEVSVSVEKTVTDFTVSAKRETMEATDKDVTGQILLLAADPRHKGWLNERRRISDVRGELNRVFNSSPRPGTIENALAELAGKGILEREREGKSWFYWLRPEAQKLIKIQETT